MKKILCIDGGGVRGLLAVVLLRHLENRLAKDNPRVTTGNYIYDYFNMFSGTSTGGILSLLLAKELSMNKIYDFYTGEAVQKIFKGKLKLNPLDAIKYPSEDINSVFSKVFGNTKLNALSKDVLITSYDMLARQARFFGGGNLSTLEMSLANVARATSAAPTYFEPHEFNSGLYLDGGLFANNPALCAYVEAKKIYPDEDILLVSIGTGSQYQYKEPSKIKKYNNLDWATNLFDLVSDGQSDTTEHLLRELLPEDRYFRFQVRLSESNSAMDNVKPNNLRDLENLAKSYISNEWLTDIDRLIKIIK